MKNLENKIEKNIKEVIEKIENATEEFYKDTNNQLDNFKNTNRLETIIDRKMRIIDNEMELEIQSSLTNLINNNLSEKKLISELKKSMNGFLDRVKNDTLFSIEYLFNLESTEEVDLKNKVFSYIEDVFDLLKSIF